MINVYFETTNGYSELIATFEYEQTYEQCYDALKQECERMGYDIITESVEN
jgi:hypothetical protein